jgi:hypothetical protein
MIQKRSVESWVVFRDFCKFISRWWVILRVAMGQCT